MCFLFKPEETPKRWARCSPAGSMPHRCCLRRMPKAIAQGFRYVVYGPDQAIPFAASTITTRRSVLAKRPQVIARFMRAMAEASKAMHRDKEIVLRVMQKNSVSRKDRFWNRATPAK